MGNGHSAAITSKGRLFVWGANNYGQLGDGTRLQQVIHVTLGTNFSAALTAKGRLFTWGINGNGQCGRGTDVEYYELPVEITSFFNLAQTDHITQISLGVQHAAAITSTWSRLHLG